MGRGKLGLITAYYQLEPRIGVIPSQNLDPSNAFATYFEVANTGYFAAKNVEAYCVINDVKFYNNLSMTGGGKFKWDGNNADLLYPNQKLSVKCDIDTNMLT